jgi:hypothetical protein
MAEWGHYPGMREKKLGQTLVHCGLKRILDNLNRQPAGIEFQVILVINQCPWLKKKKYESMKSGFPFIEKIIFRNNEGFDFGAYNAGYRHLKTIQYDGDVVLMNTGVSGPDENKWLLKYHELFHSEKNIGLVGVTMNSNVTHLRETYFAPHVQSFFLYTSMTVLKEVVGEEMPGSRERNKSEVILKGEIGLSQMILEKKYGITSLLFPNFVYYEGAQWAIPEGDMRFIEEYKSKTNRV